MVDWSYNCFYNSDDTKIYVENAVLPINVANIKKPNVIIYITIADKRQHTKR